LYFDIVLIPEESPKTRFYEIDDVELCLMYSSGRRSQPDIRQRCIHVENKMVYIVSMKIDRHFKKGECGGSVPLPGAETETPQDLGFPL
jgi:hypothetical protein